MNSYALQRKFITKEVTIMTKYREIIRLAGLNLSQTNIALSCNASKTTVNKVLKAAREQNLVWPLDPKLSDPVLGKLLFPEVKAKPAIKRVNSHVANVVSLFRTHGIIVLDCRYPFLRNRGTFEP